MCLCGCDGGQSLQHAKNDARNAHIRSLPRKGCEEMVHPTNKEREALVARLEDGRVCSPAQNSCRNGYLMMEAAAMLRACKTGDAPDKGECMHPFCGDRCGEKTKKGPSHDT